MEIFILGGVAGALLLFVWLCTLRGDQQWREKEHTEPPAPEWARLLFVLVIGGMLFLCLAPGIMQGLE